MKSYALLHTIVTHCVIAKVVAFAQHIAQYSSLHVDSSYTTAYQRSAIRNRNFPVEMKPEMQQ
jgi:hypothetical protein